MRVCTITIVHGKFARRTHNENESFSSHPPAHQKSSRPFPSPRAWSRNRQRRRRHSHYSTIYAAIRLFVVILRRCRVIAITPRRSRLPSVILSRCASPFRCSRSHNTSSCRRRRAIVVTARRAAPVSPMPSRLFPVPRRHRAPPMSIRNFFLGFTYIFVVAAGLRINFYGIPFSMYNTCSGEL